MKSFLINLLCLISTVSFGQHHYEVSMVGEDLHRIEFVARTSTQTYTSLDGIVRFESGEDSVRIQLSSVGYMPWKGFVRPGKMTVIKAIPYGRELETVEVIGSLTDDHIPALSRTSETVDRDHLRERAGNTLAESLDQVPGVHAVNTGVGISKPMIRGFVGTRVTVVDQGLRQEGQQWGMDHGLEIDQFSVDRVEVVTGAAALQYGPAAPSGLVRLLSPSVPLIGVHGSVNALIKSNNRLIGQSSELSWRKGGHFVRGRFTLQDFADYRVPAEQFLYNGFELSIPDGILKNTAGQEANYRLEYGWVRDSNTVRVTGSRFSQKIGLFPGAIGIPRQFDIGNVGDQRDVDLPYQRTVHDKLQVLVTRQGRNSFYEWRAGLQHNHREERSRPHAHGLLYIDSANTLGLGLDLYTAELSFNNHFNTERVHWAFGAGYQGQNNLLSGWEFLLPSYRRNEGNTFVTATWLMDRWTLTGGFRSDLAHLNIDEYRQPWYSDPDSLVVRVVGGEKSYAAFSGSLGIAREVGVLGISFNTAYSERIPNVAELASNGVHHGTFRHEKGNPELRKEQGLLSELTLQTSLDRIELRVTGYINIYRNFIYLAPSGIFSPLPDAGQIYEYRQSEALLYGYEFHASLPFGDHWEFTLNSDLVRGSNSETSLPLPFIPPPGISLIPEYTFGEFGIGVEGDYRFAQDRVARNEKVTGDYWLLNAYARYGWRWKGQQFTLRLRLQNILDRPYLRHISRYRILNLPEQGFNAILQAEYSF